jgi:hypothetical protein
MALPKRRAPDGDRERQASVPGSEPDWRILYEIGNPDEVAAYVSEHPTVASILEEAPREIRAVFGNDEPPRLRLEWDPEEGDCWLFVGIPSADIGPSVLPLIDALDNRWWLDRMTKTDATIVFDVDGL